MFGGASSSAKAGVGEPPKHQPRQPPPASAIPLALHAQHQHVPPALMNLGVAGVPAVTWTAAQHEEWLLAMAQPSSTAGPRRRATPASVPAAAVSSSLGRAPPTVSHAHDNERAPQQAARKETGKANESRGQAGQVMGSGALSNAIGAWTSSGIFVSRSRAGRVDESVDVGAQANPSGVYPIMQPMAYLPRPQPHPSIPSHVIHRNSGAQKQQQQQQQQQRQYAARGAAATNLRPQRTHHRHPPTFGPGMQPVPLPHEAAYSRPVSAPAGSVFHPGGGAFKRPPPPSPGVGLRRTSMAGTRGRAGSAVVGAGPSKAAMRAAARAAAAASVISAVADSRKTEARVAAAVAAAGAAVGTAAAGGSTELEAGNIGQPKGGGRSKRERKGQGGGGGNLAQDQRRRPVTAPASSASAVPAAKHAHPHPLSFPHSSAGSIHMLPWSTGVPAPMPLPMSMPLPLPSPSPSEWADQWARGQGRLDTLPAPAPAPAPPQPPPRRPGEVLALNPGTTVATPAAAEAAAAAGASAAGKEGARTEEAESLTAKSARTSPVPRPNSSPESEDTYTDSWLTGMPWASSSPPNADGLEVEVPESPAPLDALRSDDRGTRDDDDDDDDVGGGEEAVLFMGPDPTSDLQEMGGEKGESGPSALEATGDQAYAQPFPRDGESQPAKSTASPDGSTDVSRKPVVCAGGSRTPAAVIVASGGVNANNSLRLSSQSSQHEAAPTMVGASDDVRDTGCARGGISAVAPKLPPVADVGPASPQRLTGHASDTILTPAVKGPDPPPRPSASSSPVAAAAAAAAATATTATAAPPTIPTASTPANLPPPQHQIPSPLPSVLYPLSPVVADPTMRQPLPATAAASLPDWAHHPPPLLGLDVTSDVASLMSKSNPAVRPRHGPSAATRPDSRANAAVAVGEEKTAASGPSAAAAVAARSSRHRNTEVMGTPAGGPVTKETASFRRRAPETSTAAAAAADLGTARAKSPATTRSEAQPTTESPATEKARPTRRPASRIGGGHGGCQMPAHYELPGNDRPRDMGSTATAAVGAGGAGGSSPRGSKRANDAEIGMNVGAVALVAEARNDEDEQGRGSEEGDTGATATRRSKRRRSSGNLLQ